MPHVPEEEISEGATTTALEDASAERVSPIPMQMPDGGPGSSADGGAEEERDHPQREEEGNVAPRQAVRQPEDAAEAAAASETTEPRLFTVVRRADESGVSGTGRVLDGCVFHNGQVVVCWRGDINSEKSGYASLAIYPCWEAFQKVHIDAHPTNETEVLFGHGADLMARLIDTAAEEGSSGGPNDEHAKKTE